MSLIKINTVSFGYDKKNKIFSDWFNPQKLEYSMNGLEEKTTWLKGKNIQRITNKNW
jgi:hypothetical protein